MRRTAARSPVEASAPSRIDLAGGTLDIWPLSVMIPGAVTVNLAIELRARVRIEPRADDKVVVISRDRGARATRRLPLGDEDLGGPLSWLLRLVQAFAPERGLTLTASAEAPAGAGLGGSSTLGIAVGTALARWTGGPSGKEALLRRVMNAETRQIGVPTGNQDYLAAIWGGLSAFRHTVDGVVREALPVPDPLPGRLVLAYVGEPRQSGFSNWEMFRRFIDGEGRTTRRMEGIARIARELADALRAQNLDEAGKLIGEEGRLRWRLAPSVGTPALRAAESAAKQAGALGVKVCGAGGGGCLLAFTRSGRRLQVAAAIAATGARVLPVRIARRGARLAG